VTALYVSCNAVDCLFIISSLANFQAAAPEDSSSKKITSRYDEYIISLISSNAHFTFLMSASDADFSPECLLD